MLTGEIPGYKYLGGGRYQDLDRPHATINTQHCVSTVEESKKIMQNVSNIILMAKIKQWLAEHDKTMNDVIWDW